MGNRAQWLNFEICIKLHSNVHTCMAIAFARSFVVSVFPVPVFKIENE